MQKPDRSAGTDPNPSSRTVGQLVADAVRLYGNHFWRSLALGIGPAGIVIALLQLEGWSRLAFALSAGSLIVTASYIGGVLIAAGLRLDVHTTARALSLGLLIFLPVWFLYNLFVLPAVAWLALVGLAVPVAVIERGGFRDALGRAVALARVDYVHAIGSLATLVIVSFVTATAMFFAARAGSGQAGAIAAFLAFLVVSPLLFLGSALLYYDQVARLSAK